MDLGPDGGRKGEWGALGYDLPILIGCGGICLHDFTSRHRLDRRFEARAFSRAISRIIALYMIYYPPPPEEAPILYPGDQGEGESKRTATWYLRLETMRRVDRPSKLDFGRCALNRTIPTTFR